MDTQYINTSSKPARSVTDVWPFPMESMSMAPSIAEAVSLLSVESNSRVLDMYGSGRQRAHVISNVLNEYGTLMANVAGSRSMEKAGQGNRDNIVMACLTDDQLVPAHLGLFDRVLLEVPSHMARHVTPRGRFERQASLLMQAVDLCQIGGRIVYISHSQSPDDNEMVIDHVLNGTHKGLALRSIHLPDVAGISGYTQWNSQQLDPRMANTVRIPASEYHNGGFLAVMECMH